jgi:hypothetical protein
MTEFPRRGHKKDGSSASALSQQLIGPSRSRFRETEHGTSDLLPILSSKMCLYGECIQLALQPEGMSLG